MFCPAFTGFGLAEFVTLRSACVAPATAIMLVAELLFGFVSCVAVATVAVSVMMVPMGVPALTFTTTGNVLVEPGATLGLEQLMDPVVVHVHPAGTGLSETNVVLAGKASVKVALAQLLGPLLVTTCVYVILPAGATGLGLPLFVTTRSHCGVTLVTTVVLLLAELGSPVVAEMEEFAVIVATTTVEATFTTTMMSADAPAARVGSVHVTEVVTVQVQPTGAETEANVVLPGITVAGVPTVVRARSAWMPVATTSVAVAELGPKAWFAALTVAVSVMTVPLAVPAFTV